MTSDIEHRKRAHIDTVLSEDVGAKGITTGFEHVYFEHVALPEIDLDAINMRSPVFGKTLAAPLLISSMTGGTDIAQNINRHLAEAAQEMAIAMGVGSQRAAIVDPMFADTFRVRSVAPDILLFANLGAIQFNYGFTPDDARKAVDMIGADALFLHLNPLQEAVQAEGDRNWAGVLEKIGELAGASDVPVIVKEVGNGISAALARRLADIGVAGIDVAGAGGTSWSEVEAHRQLDEKMRRVAHSFAGWGIPTARALTDVRAALPNTPVIASGGVRTGIDAAKAIRLGADLVGMGAPALGSAMETAKAVENQLSAVVEELKIAMFCTGSRDIPALRQAVLRNVADGEPV
ncbi:MAG: type 2 isopentenyl-diphosphate Delta-isomerase [Rhodospirillaceae bacterium]|nr:MAG: type 2 isopentenyl-diphosphate Delta-isomerase [Rhodospirillaceae bacterium]